MQTFMTDRDYATVSYQLDNKRLGKQRVETYQIMRSLTGISGGWINHPATQMWKGYEYSLAEYGLQMCEEWLSRGFKDSLYQKFADALDSLPYSTQPWWVANLSLHQTHQSNLLRKDFAHYSQHFQVQDDLPYVWPLPTEETFRLGTLKDRTTDMTMINGVIYLTATQVAEMCGVSKGTITAYKARGQMPPPDKEFGRTPMWSYNTIQAWRNPEGGLPKPQFNDKTN
jgi:predicted DNA-binding transcriptional regulator AlpA